MSRHLTRPERYRLIEPALEHPPGSPERGAAIAAAVRASGKDQATVRRWIAGYEADGWAGITRQERPDARQNRVYVTRAWDSAVPFDDATKARIAAELRGKINTLFAASPEYGWRMIGRIAATHLEDWTREAGFKGGEAQLRQICRLAQHVVMQGQDWRRFRNVAIHDHDAKRWHDETMPRVRRTRAGRKPMEIVFGDVHPMDILLPRPDGSTFTAKLIAFEDWGTGRLFGVPVFLGKGEGVRQEHIAAAFVAMTQEPGWGVPETLYIDNGGEYGCVDMVSDALIAAKRMRLLTGELEAVDWQTTVRAMPYNAASKPIEPAFARLERILAGLPGWIGGNRMKKKTANVGREPVPYPHGREAFEEDLAAALVVYETQPKAGGRSPRDLYEAAVAEGWRPARIAPEDLLAAFARDESRTVRQGAFTFKGRRYTTPELQALPAGAALHLRVPIFSGTDAIAVMREGGGLLCVAFPDAPFDALDRARAREAGQRRATARAGVKAARGETGPADLRAELSRLASRAGPATDPEAGIAVPANAGGRAVGRAVLQAPAARRKQEAEANEISRRQWREAIDGFLGKTGTDG